MRTGLVRFLNGITVGLGGAGRLEIDLERCGLGGVLGGLRDVNSTKVAGDVDSSMS